MDNHSGDTARLYVGTPPRGFQPLDVAEVHFHGFKDLPTENYVAVASPEFTCLGRQWCCDVYPGGEEDSDDGMVAVYVMSMHEENLAISQVLIPFE